MSSINQGAQVLLGSGLPLFTENPRRVRAGNWFPRIHSSPEAQRRSSHSPVRYSCIGPATSGIHRDAERTSSRKLVAVIRATRASARERTRFSCHSTALSEPCGPSRNSCSWPTGLGADNSVKRVLQRLPAPSCTNCRLAGQNLVDHVGHYLFSVHDFPFCRRRSG